MRKGLVFASLCVILLLVGLYHFNIPGASTERPNKAHVKIASVMGCLETTDDQETFDKKQNFLYDMEGYRYLQCPEDGNMYTAPIGPTQNPPYALPSSLKDGKPS